MAKLKKTPKQSMKYWAVGPRRLKIRARTARAAARKYLRGSFVMDFFKAEYELDNVFSGDTFDGLMNDDRVRNRLRRTIRCKTADDVLVVPWT